MAENKHIAGKEKTAVAVAYNPGEVAPKILAVGKGEVAERIIETAKENDVPFYQDNKPAETLSRLQPIFFLRKQKSSVHNRPVSGVHVR